MKVKGTPIIVREDEAGNLVALFPTLPGTLIDDTCATLDTRKRFDNELYVSFMKRTSEVSDREAKKYIQAMPYDGTYTLVEKETRTMRQNRQGRAINNIDMLPHSEDQEV